MSPRKIPRHRRQRLHRLGAREGLGEGRRKSPRARRQFARPTAPARRYRKEHRIHRRRYPRRRRGRQGPPPASTRCITSPSSTARNSSTARPNWCSTSACVACSTSSTPAASTPSAISFSPLRPRSIRRRPHVPTAEDAPLVVPDVMNPRYSYGRRQADQRGDSDQLRAANISSACWIFPAAQCLRPGHGLRACHPAIRAAHQKARGPSSPPAGCLSKSRAPARRRAASATSTTWSPASW